jgi:hypothetical protein
MRVLPIAILAAACGTTGGPPTGAPITAPWRDDFERGELGPDWYATDPAAYRIEGGALTARDAHNHPLWLRRPLPVDAVIELDAWSMSSAGDLKLEIYGDGRSHATDRGQYTSTGVVAVFGGWSNSVSVLVAGNEHRADRPERRTPKVEVGRRYHWKLVKRGGTVEWFLDGDAAPFLRYEGPALAGDDHRFLGINDWESEVYFDNLTVTPL